MASSTIAGTFSTGSTASVGNVSDTCVIPSGVTTMRISTSGLDASNTVRTEKRTTPGGTFTAQTTYSTDQNSAAVTVAPGEEWRLFQLTQQPIRDVRYRLQAL